MNVSACLVTRGDVYMEPILDSLPAEWEVLVWDNGRGNLRRWFKNDGFFHGEQYEPEWQKDMSVADAEVDDLSVYGRYAAIEYATNDLIYVQDDDAIVSDPQAIVDEWLRLEAFPEDHPGHPHACHVVCNMPQEFRHDGYLEHSLVGFGAAFHRDAPGRAFKRFDDFDLRPLGMTDTADEFLAWYRRTCDIVFTGLTPCVRVDVPHEDREMASDPNRMWKQADHVAERTRMLDLVRKLK